MINIIIMPDVETFQTFMHCQMLHFNLSGNSGGKDVVAYEHPNGWKVENVVTQLHSCYVCQYDGMPCL